MGYAEQGALSGAASGAAAGASFGPWGAAIGGVVGAIGGWMGGDAAEEEEKRKAAEAKARLQQQLADIGKAERFGLQQLDKEEAIAMQRAGEAGRIGGAYREAEEQLGEGYQRGSAALAGAKGDMQRIIESALAQEMGGGVAGDPMMALGGGSAGGNIQRIAALNVAQSGMPLDLAKQRAGFESEYGAKQAGLTVEGASATAGAREMFRSGLQDVERARLGFSQDVLGQRLGATGLEGWAGAHYGQEMNRPFDMGAFGQSVGTLAGAVAGWGGGGLGAQDMSPGSAAYQAGYGVGPYQSAAPGTEWNPYASGF